MDKIKEYNSGYYFQMYSWYKARKLDCPPIEYFPSTGFIVPNVAAGFVFYTNSPVAIIDGYISNPMASKDVREASLELISESLIHLAKDEDYKLIRCYTSLKCISVLARKFGFKDQGSFVNLVKEI